MKKQCPDCGRFMRLTDRMPECDEVDWELLEACGIDEKDYDPFNEAHQRFSYIYDQWLCNYCHILMPHVEGKRYYFNPEENDYSGKKPLTPAQKKQKRINDTRRQARRAGQLGLFPE